VAKDLRFPISPFGVRGFFTATGIAPDFNRIPFLIPDFNPETNYAANVKAIKL
jgi:hypothetical protein